MMRKLILGLMVTMCIAIFENCSPKKKIAPDRNFYFEVTTHDNTELSVALATYLKSHIAEKKYTITHHSGMTWPFYKELGLNEEIVQDSLMPPHWFVHRMIPATHQQEINRDEFLVKIDLQPKRDTLPNYSVTIFKMDSVGLSLSAETGIHYIDSTEFSSKNSLFETYLRSIVRYSFK